MKCQNNISLLSLNIFRWAGREYLVTTGDCAFIEFFELDCEDLKLTRSILIDPEQASMLSCITKFGDSFVFSQMKFK